MEFNHPIPRIAFTKIQKIRMIVDDTIEHLENIAIGDDPHEEKVTNE